MLKTEKELLQEIYNDTLKNDLSRKIELEHLQGFVTKKVKKMKNKEHLETVGQKIKILQEEQGERKNVLGLIRKLIK